MTENQIPSIAPAVGKGCLGGIALAVVFFVVSGTTFVLLRAIGLPQNIVWLISILSGPIVGITGTLFFVWFRVRTRPAMSEERNETTSRDAA